MSFRSHGGRAGRVHMRVTTHASCATVGKPARPSGGASAGAALVLAHRLVGELRLVARAAPAAATRGRARDRPSGAGHRACRAATSARPSSSSRSARRSRPPRSRRPRRRACSARVSIRSRRPSARARACPSEAPREARVVQQPARAQLLDRVVDRGRLDALALEERPDLRDGLLAPADCPVRVRQRPFEVERRGASRSMARLRVRLRGLSSGASSAGRGLRSVRLRILRRRLHGRQRRTAGCAPRTA